MTNYTIPETEEADNDSSWRRGVEKMVAEAPTTIRAMAETDGRVDDHLHRLLKWSVGCQGTAWVSVYRHSASPGEYSGRLNTNSCRQRGCPTCREATAWGQLREDEARIRSVFADGAVALRLEADDGLGPDAVRKTVGRLLRRRPVQAAIEPMVRVYSVGGSGRFGATLLVPGKELADLLADRWVEAGDAVATVEALEGDAFEMVVQLRADAAARIFEAVDEGVLDPATAREWLAQDIGKKRYGWVGAGSTVATTDAAEAGDEVEALVESVDDVQTQVRPSVEELTTVANTLAEQYEQGSVRDERFESAIRSVADRARDRGDFAGYRAAKRIETHLDLLPAQFGNCVRHDRCRLIPTGKAIRTVDVDAAVKFGRVAHDEANDEFLWTDETWPQWHRRAERIPDWEGDGRAADAE